MQNIEITEEFETALDIVKNTKQNLFITGKAGTGKSTLISLILEKSGKNCVVVAPTGIAALNVGGTTIHRFFRFPANITPEAVKRVYYPDAVKILNSLQVLIIDEISMVRADLLDCIDKSLRINKRRLKEPFGGVQIIFVGDMFQLPPVLKQTEANLFYSLYKSPYFFDSNALANVHVNYLELKTIFRQADKNFISLLNAIRTKNIDYDDLEILNKRYIADFQPSNKDYFLTLCATNAVADQINLGQLAAIPSEEFTFLGSVSGKIDERAVPSDPILKLKRNTQVMFTKNDPDDRWVNGTIGVVEEIKFDSIKVLLDTGELVKVEKTKWEFFDFQYDDAKAVLKQVPVGSFEQYPLRLAWALTIHKSQGLTFDKVVIDVGRGAFAHGQLYVALSRCKSLQGIILRSIISGKDIIVDERIVEFESKLSRG